jgi:hypothetical protein
VSFSLIYRHRPSTLSAFARAKGISAVSNSTGINMKSEMKCGRQCSIATFLNTA